MALNLFAAAADQAKKDVLVEFKAGRMVKEEKGRLVRPETAKGQVQLRQLAEDGLIHFQWRDRTTGSLGMDLTIFPGEALWKRVKECTTGRVYVLEFPANKKLHFFWLQEPKEDKDEEFATKMSQFLKDPPAQESQGGSGLDQQLSQMLAQAGLTPQAGRRTQSPASTTSTPATSTPAPAPAPATPAAPAPAKSASTGVPANDGVRLALQNILSGVLQNAPEEKEPKGPSLNDILRSDDVLATGVLSDPEVRKELQQHLPAEEKDKDTVQRTLRTPQFRQAVGAFDSALAQGHITELLAPLGLQPSNQPSQNNQQAFLNAVQQNADKEKEKKDKEANENKDDKMDTS